RERIPKQAQLASRGRCPITALRESQDVDRQGWGPDERGRVFSLTALPAGAQRACAGRSSGGERGRGRGPFRPSWPLRGRLFRGVPRPGQDGPGTAGRESSRRLTRRIPPVTCTST